MDTAYHIWVRGERVAVSRQVYLAYHKMGRRWRYYEHDIKIERKRIVNGQAIYCKSKEDSLDRLAEVGRALCTERDLVESLVEFKVLCGQMYRCLDELEEEEYLLLHEIYWNRLSERALAQKTGIPQRTINDRKRRLLERLRVSMKV